MKIRMMFTNSRETFNVYASDEEDKQVVINKRRVPVDVDDFIMKVLYLTNTWESKYYLSGHDGEEFHLLFENEGEQRCIDGERELPPKYSQLLTLIKRCCEL